MTPGTFEYHRPGTVEEVLGLLARYGDEGKVLAGGHSLVPMMKLRLAQPAHLIDIAGLAEFGGVSEDGNDIVIGARTTQAEILRSALLAEKCPILCETAALIADPQVRYCGTIGGNCANGDPGNDDPAVMLALDARYVLLSQAGRREVAARDFYEGVYATALGDSELLAEIRIPQPSAGTGMSYRKVKRKVGDYAIAAAAVTLRLDGATCAEAAVALTNVADTAILVPAAADALKGTDVDAAAIDAAATAAMAACQPASDLRGPAAFRTAMAGEMTRRAIDEARRRAAGG